MSYLGLAAASAQPSYAFPVTPSRSSILMVSLLGDLEDLEKLMCYVTMKLAFTI